ncbi:MAG: hypothetical protein LUG18_01865 [Candidatus Azobacteroides sp.]|nr:hypothetical protein [Candidatus Azobacteroides sp.]
MDNPPVGLVSDSLILAKYADITLYVVRHNYTVKESVKGINELYNKNRFKELGIVINGMTDDTMYYGYKRSSSYYKSES